MPLTRPSRATHGSDADRRWHLAHGNGATCHTCWPASGGLPPMPEATDRYPEPLPAAGWLDALLDAEFGSDVPAEVA